MVLTIVEWALLEAWGLAAVPGQDRVWRTRIWPLIFRVETALLQHERDLEAEDSLVTIVRDEVGKVR